VSHEPPSFRQSWSVPATIVAVGFVLAGAWVMLGAPDAVAPPTAMPEAAVVGVPVPPGVVVAQAGDPSLGAADAPRTVFLFTQWHCAFCRHFFEATFPQLRRELIDTGRVRLVIKAFPIGDESQPTEQARRAAEAAYCAHEQGAFWEYTERLVARGAGYEAGELARYARDEGLQEEAFMACLEGGEYAEVVATTIRTAVAAGITATPAFVIDDQLYEGALSYAELAQILR